MSIGIRSVVGTLAASIILAGGGGMASAGEFCVENASEQQMLFVVEPKGGERALKMLQVGEKLCVDDDTATAGTVGVFENEEVLEGCSHLVTADVPEQLVAYSAYDNCAWK